MNRNSGWTIPVVIAVIIAVIVGILFFTGTIAAAVIGVPILFATIFAGVSLVLLFVGATFSERKEVRGCIKEFGTRLFVGVTGTLILGFLGLTFLTLLVAGSLVSALLITFGTFFFILAFISLIELIACLVENIYHKKEDFC